MIGYLRGKILYKDVDTTCIDTGGLNGGGTGYVLRMPLTDLARLGKVGEVGAAFVHTHVREGAIDLFGFENREGLAVFELLISISGVGPRTGLAVLSGMTVDEVLSTVASGDEVRLCRVPGIGKKTAARLVLELKDKLAKKGIVARHSADDVGGSKLSDVGSALMNLGYKGASVDKALKKIEALATEKSIEELVLEALRHV